MFFRISSIILGFSALFAVGAVHAGLKSTLKKPAKHAFSKVKEKAEKLSDRVREVEDKVSAKAKQFGNLLVGQISDFENLLVRLDNAVSAETILKMQGLLLDDMEFQFNKRIAKVGPTTKDIENKLKEVDEKIASVIEKMAAKKQANLNKYKADMEGNAQARDAAERILKQNNEPVLTVLSGVGAFINNDFTNKILNIVKDGLVNTKRAAQQDVDRFNDRINELQSQYDRAQDELTRVIDRSKEVLNLRNEREQIDRAFGALINAFEIFRDSSDAWNYTKLSNNYQDVIENFIAKAQCTYAPGMDAQQLKYYLKICKEHIIFGDPSNPSSPYLQQDNRFKREECKNLDGNSDIYAVEQCITNSSNVTLTSFPKD